MPRFALLTVFGLLSSLTAIQAAETPPTPAALHFEQAIRPVLVNKCLKCHGEKKQEGHLRLDSREAMLTGGDSGPAIVPGKPEESLLIEAIKYESFEMPPTGQLMAKDIQGFERWIREQAVWPESIGQLREGSATITESDKEWWAFQPLAKPEVPQPAGDHWSKNDIDRFVQHRLIEKDMQPAPRADRLTLLRRLYFDLIGLPPTPEEIQAFLKQPDSEKTWESLIDKLLDDPRYGEHWARHWLDVVRFAESDGWNQDAFRPHIWRYRDYVINAFNNDKPYPDFVREQLAGDEIPGDNPEHLAAVGFLRLGIYEYNQRDARSHWDDIMNEITDVTADVFLGMGMACARCHDHKFDPLLQRDYFKLRAFFEPLVWRDDIPYATIAQQQAYEQQRAVWEAKTASIREQIDAILKPYHDKKWKSTADKFPLDIQAAFYKPVEERTSWEHQMAYLVSRQFEEEGGGPLKDMKKDDKEKYEALKKELAAFDDIKPKPLGEVMTITDFAGKISPTIIPDGEPEPIPPGFLTVLGNEKPQLSLGSQTTGRRTALAEWIGRPDNPLTTRVIVNRIWQYHFGQGISPTASDFGHLGLPPTHPELLDWLTVTFVEDGWSFKKLHKRILTSATWQQSAHHPQAKQYQEKDPAESLMWRSRIRRLTAEQIRDAMLTASGELQTKVGGSSVDTKTPRRAIYVKSFRNNPDPFLAAFDMANGLKSVPERNTTTTPTQSLMMINGSYTLGRAKQLADRLVKRKLSTPVDTIEYACQITWGRNPTPEELAAAKTYIYGTDDKENGKNLTDFCHILFNSNEFLYVD